MDPWLRRLRDLCADCYNQWQKWQELNADAIVVAQSMANDRILLIDPIASSSIDPEFDSDAVRFRLDETCSKKVPSMLEKFERIVGKFRKYASDLESMKKLRDLDDSKSNEMMVDGESYKDRSASSSSKEFNRLVRLVDVLNETSRRELTCKTAAFADLPLASTRDMTIICVSCFVHQPYVDEVEISLLLEACVLENGHKNP